MSTPATLNGQELELFRVGNYGKKGSYTREDLQELAASYAAADQAAVTIGHPASDSEPAFGWIKSVRVDGDVLKGTPGEVVPHIDSLVQAGAYKHRSVGLSRGADGKLRLRHVALLGAMPPAVQGLKPARFSGDPYQEFAIGEGENMADDAQLKKTVGDSIREFFSELGGKKAEPAQADIDAALARVEARFSTQIEAERTARIAAETKFADHQKQFASTAAETRAQQAVLGLKEKGFWVPAYETAGVPAIFSLLAAQPQVITFSEGDKKVDKDALQVFSDLLTSVGKIVPAGQLFKGANAEQSKPLPRTNGGNVDPESQTFSEMVTKYATENKVSWNDAYSTLELLGNRPVTGASAAGAV